MTIKGFRKIDIGVNATASVESDRLCIRYTKGGSSHVARLSVLSSPAAMIGIEAEGFSAQTVMTELYAVKVNGLEVSVSAR